MPSDLHIHTCYSDGVLSPEELLAVAKEVGLSYIAITDHDTVDGIKELYEHGLLPAKGIRVIPGLEFSAHHDVRTIHIIGYNIDVYNRELADRLNELVEGRWTRFSKMVAKLQQLGYEISEADVLEVVDTSSVISRAHIAQALVKKGAFSTISEAFEEALNKGKPAYEPHFRMEVGEIIDLIKRCGGTPVLAHPKLVRDDKLVEEILRSGIEGIEAFYPQHNEADTKRYLAMAEKYHLMVAGGSDYHGISTRYPSELGVFTINDELAAEFYIVKE